MSDQAFIYPMREADIWGLNEDGEQRDNDDIAADLEFNQRAVEDYLSNTLPAVYIQQADLGSGVIDPAMLATGAASSGRAPVIVSTSVPVWTDIFTQSEANASIVGVYDSQDIQRGIFSANLPTGTTNTTVTNSFTVNYAASPRVVTQVECQAGTGLFPTLNGVTSVAFTVKVFALSAVGATTTFFVHWHAIKA